MEVEYYKRKIIQLLTHENGLPTYELQKVVEENVDVPYFELNLNFTNSGKSSIGAFTPNIHKAILELSNEDKIYFVFPENITQHLHNMTFSLTNWTKNNALWFEDYVWCMDHKRFPAIIKKGKTPFLLSYVFVGDRRKEHMKMGFKFKTSDDNKSQIVWFQP